MRVEDDMKTCYIIAAAELAEERLRPQEGDLVIAADAGLKHLARLGIQLSLIHIYPHAHAGTDAGTHA